jgi:hypothetical protein
MRSRFLSGLIPFCLVLLWSASTALGGTATSEECLRACRVALEEGLRRCKNDNGTLNEDCAARVRAAYELCAHECQEPDEPPPPEPTCEETCRHKFESILAQECTGRDGGVNEECAARARALLEACLVECQPPPPPPPSCERACMARYEEVVKSECTTAAGSVDRECVGRARSALESCLADCAPPPPSCEASCEKRYQAVIENECTGEDGAVNEECAARAKANLDRCLASCQPPPPPDCGAACERRYHAVVQTECTGEDGSVNEECVARARALLEICLKGCNGEEEPPPPPPTCETRCKAAAEEFLRNCRAEHPEMARLDNDGIDDDCERRARAFLADCLQRCDGEPPPATCKDRCAAASRELAQKCIAEGGDAEACRARAAEFLERCAEGCEDHPPLPCLERCRARIQSVIEECIHGALTDHDVLHCRERLAELTEACRRECEPPPPPPNCEARCKESAEAALRRCAAEGGDRDECQARAERVLQACLRESCGHEPPAPPPSCEDRCEEHYRKAVAECLAANPDATADACAEKLKPGFEACLLRCQDQPPPACADRCRAGAEEVYQKCIAEHGDSEESQRECAAASRQALEECRAHCEQPDPPTCVERCALAAKALRERCRESEEPAVCEERVETILKRCMEGCQPPPPRPSCEERCRAAIRKVFEECLERGHDEAECREVASSFGRRCVDFCDHGPAPDCGDRCAHIARRFYSECLEENGEDASGDCKEKAHEILKQCLSRCEQPPVPCGERCAERARHLYSECIAGKEKEILACVEAGGDPAECERQAARECRQPAAEFLARCLRENCPQPEPEPPSCAERCDASVARFLEECEADGGEGCAEKARELRRLCLTRCEGDRPLPDCDADCEELGRKLAERCAASEASEEECASRVAEFVEHCKARLAEACEVREAALERAPLAFRRGDVNRDQSFNISDVIATLGGLFLGETAYLNCADASDMNDDGGVDVSDPVYGLQNQFLGGAPIPEPAGAEGHDPTADALLCEP